MAHTPEYCPPELVAVGAAALGGIVVTIGSGAPDFITVALFGALIFALDAGASGSRLLSSSTVAYFGEVSFAVYMVCIRLELVYSKLAARVFHLTDGPMPWPSWTAMFATVVGVAMAAHHLVERPARLTMRTWEGHGFRVHLG